MRESVYILKSPGTCVLGFLAGLEQTRICSTDSILSVGSKGQQIMGTLARQELLQLHLSDSLQRLAKGRGHRPRRRITRYVLVSRVARAKADIIADGW